MKYLLLFCLALFSIETCLALDLRSEASVAQSIVKWCDHDSGHERYASSGITPAGYEPCGELAVVAYCDALGNKYIGPLDNVPFGYKDCKLGPRIYAEKDGQPVDVPALFREDVARLAKIYREKLEERKREKAQQVQPAKANIPFGDLFGPEDPSKGPPDSADINLESFETILKLLLQSKSIFEQVANEL